MEVERVDFVSFLTQDIARTKRFYAEILELEIETDGPDDMEFRAGQVTLDIFNPASQGQPFAPSLGGMALRVPDVVEARNELEAKGVAFDGDTLDLASATWPSSTTSTGTRSCCTAATRRPNDEGRAGRLHNHPDP
jgi:catechol 2,3-dioxygenase-like lactoylglutathione lyase family enzyme